MGNANAENGLERLTGSWNVEIATAEHGGGPGLMTFTSDGIVMGDEAPLPFETAAHGNWIASGAGQAAYTFVAFIGNAEMKPPSRLKVVGELVYDAAADAWRGPFQIEIVEADGQRSLADHGTMSGTRIAVERLAWPAA
jgi:hypothetical protein